MSRQTYLDLESSMEQRDDFTLADLRQNSHKHEILSIIDNFFSISVAFDREDMMATKIKKAFKRMKLRK